MTQYPEWVKNQVRERLAAGETQNQPQELFGAVRINWGRSHCGRAFFGRKSVTASPGAVRQSRRTNNIIDICLGRLPYLLSFLSDQVVGKSHKNGTSHHIA